jgi:hypothetical protein
MDAGPYNRLADDPRQPADIRRGVETDLMFLGVGINSY